MNVAKHNAGPIRLVARQTAFMAVLGIIQIVAEALEPSTVVRRSGMFDEWGNGPVIKNAEPPAVPTPSRLQRRAQVRHLTRRAPSGRFLAKRTVW